MGKDLKGKELGEGLRQRTDGQYEGRYIDRFGRRRSCYSKNLNKVKKALNDKIYENDHDLSIVQEGIRLSDWFERWMAAYKSESVRENTKRHYTQVFQKHISPVLGHLPISEITHFQVQLLINSLKNEGLGWETQNKVRVLITDMYNRAMIDNFARKNPAKGVRLASNKPQSDTKFLTEEEQFLFFERCAGTWYDNLFNVAVNTGLRPGELYALTWDDIDLEKKVIHVRHTLVYQKYLGEQRKEFHLEQPKTIQSIRDVPINDSCGRYLIKQHRQKSVVSERYSNKEAFSDRLFVTRKNTPLNAQIYTDAIHAIIYDINEMRDTFDQIELFSGHTFRHTFATRCIEAGIQPKVLQELLGHASLQMTMDLYVHNTMDSKIEAMDILQKEMEKLSPTISRKVICGV